MTDTEERESEDRDARLNAAMASYLEAVDDGTEPDREEYLERYGDFADELKLFFRNQDYLERKIASEARADEKPHGAEALSDLKVPGVPLLDGHSMGKYQIAEEIARGGMGVVYRAHDTELRRPVALKLIASGRLASKDAVRRFHREAEAAAALDHPNIVPVYEIGEASGVHYLSMKLVEGGDLTAHIPRLTADHRAAARLVAQVARAVQYAHDRGVFHRDLKPANLLIDEAGRPYVTDFGLAKLAAQDDASLTQSGALLGTLKYMAPDQALGRRNGVDGSVDVYSLGVILYELLVGSAPFQADSSVELLRQVLQDEPPPPSRSNHRIPADLETICLKCLEKESAKRYASAAGLAADLERFLDGLPISARPIRAHERALKWSRRRPAAAALVVVSLLSLLCLAALGVWSNGQQRERAASSEAREETSRRYLYAAHMNLAQEAIQHNQFGRARMFLERHLPRVGEADARSFEWFYLYRLCHLDDRTMRSSVPGPISRVLFSPWGAYVLGAAGDDGLKRWRVAGGEELSLLSVALGLSLCADGSSLAVGLHEKVAFVDTTSWTIDRKVPAGAGRFIGALAFSPDSRLLAIGTEQGELKIWEAATGAELRRLDTGRGSPITHVHFSPDGAMLVAPQHTGRTLVWNTATWELIQTWEGERATVRDAVFSPDGHHLVTAEAEGSIRFWDTTSWEEDRRLAGHQDDVLSVTFSHDGTRLASGGGDHSVKLWDLESSQQLATFRGHELAVSSVRFSPNDSLLASSSADGTVKLWSTEALREPRRSFEPLRLEGQSAVVRTARFSPDGRFLSTTADDFRLRIWKIHDRWGGMHTALPRFMGFSTRKYVNGDHSPDLRWSVLGTKGGKVDVARNQSMDVELSAKTVQTLSVHRQGWVRGISFSPDSTLLAASAAREVKVWALRQRNDQASWEIGQSFQAPFNGTGLTFSQNNRFLAVSKSEHKLVVLYDLSASGVGSRIATGHSVHSTAIDPATRILATGGSRKIRLWRLDHLPPEATTEDAVTLDGHSDTVTALAFSPGGERLASASSDGTVKLWDLFYQEDELLAAECMTLRGHKGEILCLNFSPDGRALVTGGTGGEVRVWLADDDAE